jgi:hypothetical protein
MIKFFEDFQVKVSKLPSYESCYFVGFQLPRMNYDSKAFIEKKSLEKMFLIPYHNIQLYVF